jgi:hypothetical protein
MPNDDHRCQKRSGAMTSGFGTSGDVRYWSACKVKADVPIGPTYFRF